MRRHIGNSVPGMVRSKEPSMATSGHKHAYQLPSYSSRSRCITVMGDRFPSSPLRLTSRLDQSISAHISTAWIPASIVRK